MRDAPADMSGEVAVVTGGTRGIGRETAETFAARGATTVATYRADEDAAADARAALAEYEAPTEVVQFDVGDWESVDGAFDRIDAEHGTVTALVNNAGVFERDLFVRMDPEDWESTIQTNLTGTFNCTRKVARSMLLGDGGAIVNVTSVAGLRGWAGQAHYAASKAGVVGLTRSLARELADRDVRVNAVAPGYTETSMVEDLAPGGASITDEEPIPQDRVADPAEIAECIAFLASERASYLTGEVVRVDGGLLA